MRAAWPLAVSAALALLLALTLSSVALAEEDLTRDEVLEALGAYFDNELTEDEVRELVDDYLDGGQADLPPDTTPRITPRGAPRQQGVQGQQQTATVQVGNTGQADEHSSNANKANFSKDHAQAFTTGSSATGYKLTRVDWQMSWPDTSQGGSWQDTMKIHNVDANDRPGTVVGTLTWVEGNTDYTEDPDQFTSTAGIDLNANTTYFVVFDVTDGINFDGTKLFIETTTSDSEDSGAATGWSISNKRYARAHGATTWTASHEVDSAVQIAVHGYAKDTTKPTVERATIDSAGEDLTITFSEDLDTTKLPAASSFTYRVNGTAQTTANGIVISGSDVTLTWTTAVSTSGTLTLDYAKPTANPLQDAGGNKVDGFMGQAVSSSLVSNIGQANGTAGTGAFNRDRAQEFTAGSGTGQYKLTSVEVDFAAVGSEPNYTASILASTSGNPGTQVGTLTKPSALAAGVNTFTGDVDLDAGSKYFLFIDVTGSHTGVTVQFTQAPGEDTGAATGWSINNSTRHRATTSTGGFTSLGRVMKIRVNGYRLPDTTPPTVTSATIGAAGRTLTIQLSETNLKGSFGGGDFTLSVDGASRGATGGWSPATGTLNLTVVGAAVTSGQTVLLHYNPGGFRIRDQADNPLAGFTNEPVQNDSQVQGVGGTPPPPVTLPPTVFPPGGGGGGGGGGGTVFPGPWISPTVHHVAVNAWTVTVTMDKPVALDPRYSTAQLAGFFTVRFNGAVAGLRAASAGGSQVVLSLAAQAPRNAKLSVQYTKGPLLDAASPANQVEGFGYFSSGTWISPKPNRVDVSGRTVVVNMDKPVVLDGGYSGNAAAQFTVRIDGNPSTPTGVSVSGRDVTLTMPSTFVPPGPDTRVSVDYAKGPLLEAAYSANQVEGFGIYSRTPAE